MDNEKKPRKVTPVKDYRGYKMGDLSQEVQDILILNESRYSDKFATIVWTKDFPRQYGISLEQGNQHAELIKQAINSYEPMQAALSECLIELLRIEGKSADTSIKFGLIEKITELLQSSKPTVSN